MDLFGIALSGMQAAQTQLNATAQNIANSDTPGDQRQRVDRVELSTGGVASSVSSDSGPPDLPSDLIHLTRAKLLYSANAAVLKVGQRLTGSLLDMMDNDHKSEAHSKDRHR